MKTEANVLASTATTGGATFAAGAPQADASPVGPRAVQLIRLTKPRVVSLIVFTAVIGMFLAVPGTPPAERVAFATIGIWLVAGAAAGFNCLVEQKIDAAMARTRARPTVMG